MLNLTVVMRRTFEVFLFVSLLLLPGSVARAQESSDLAIASPQPGQVLQGLVIIKGTVDVLGLSSYQLAFAYAQDTTGTWFPIESGTSPVYDGDLGTWDTTVLTDGDYTLRLQAWSLDGGVRELLVEGLRVRNYTAAPTEAPTTTATAFAQLVIPTARYVEPPPATATASFPTPTALPDNPVALDRRSIYAALGRGAWLALLAIAVLAFVLQLRKEK